MTQSNVQNRNYPTTFSRPDFCFVFIFGAVGAAAQSRESAPHHAAPKFRIASTEYASGNGKRLLIFASVSAKYFNCADMVSIVRQIKMRFPTQVEIDVTFFTSYRSAKTFSTYPGSTDYVRNMKSMAAGYNLNGRTGSEVLTYSPEGYLPKNTQKIDLTKSPACPSDAGIRH